MKNKRYGFVVNNEQQFEDEMISLSINGEPENKESQIDSWNNKIYFFDSVNEISSLKLRKLLDERVEETLFISRRFQLKDIPPIKLHIHSNGGLLYVGLALYDYIKSLPVPVHTIVDGVTASAATFISLAGKKRFITKHSHMLIHQISSGVWGSYHNISDHMANSTQAQEQIEKMYIKNTKIKPSEIKKILTHDLYFDAQQCVEFSLVDKIL